jgi:5-methylcytosine-specific restriction endonuclease McrA
MVPAVKAEITAMFEERSAWIERLRQRAERHVAEDLAASLNCSMRAESVRGLTRRQCGERRRCFLCGKWPIGTRRQHWCSDACGDLWYRNHSWGGARLAALRRDGYKCVRAPEHREPKEVNHIDPRNGRGYHEGCMHHLDGLETLCHPCHVTETTRQLRERVGQGVVQGVTFVVQGDRQ